MSNITKIKIKIFSESREYEADGSSLELSGKMVQARVLCWMQLSTRLPIRVIATISYIRERTRARLSLKRIPDFPLIVRSE